MIISPRQLLVILLLICPAARADVRLPHSLGSTSVPDAVTNYPYILGTQSIGVAYQFTQQPKLLETAHAIADLGSNTIKFALGPDYVGNYANIPSPNPAITTLTQLARDEPTHRRVLDMPFATYVLWTYPFADRGIDVLQRPATEQEARRQYQEIYDFARHLLTTYTGSHKTFYLGHWEGDWMLLGGYNPNKPIDPRRAGNMIAWLNRRQQAIDDARRDTPHRDVEVYHYAEVNLVRKGIGGKGCMATDVLPFTQVDLVSYSCYDSIGGKDIAGDLAESLSFIESKLKPKPGLNFPGRRVFIGEYGFAAINCPPARQNQLSIQVMKAAMQWGCPMVLYWQIYCNERRGDRYAGFWMIDDKAVKQPIYTTHQEYFRRARAYVADILARTGQPPTQAEYLRQSLHWLAELER